MPDNHDDQPDLATLVAELRAALPPDPQPYTDLLLAIINRYEQQRDTPTPPSP